MKIHTNILAIGLVALLLMVSCSKGNEQSQYDNEKEVMVTLATNSNGAITRAPGDADPKDNKMSSLRVLGYRTSNGTLAFNHLLAPSDYSVNNDDHKEAKIKVKTGSFTFVFVANEGALNLSDANVPSINALYAQTINQSAFSSTSDVPMVTVVNKAVVLETNKVTVYDNASPGTSNTYTTQWPVKMERAGVRLRINVTLKGSLYTQWMNVKNSGKPYIKISNLPSTSFLMPAKNNFSYQAAANSRVYTADNTGTLDGKIETVSADEYKVTFERLILPELLLGSNVGNKNYGLQLEMSFSPNADGSAATIKKGRIASVPTSNYSLPRNKFLDVTANVKDFNIEFAVTAEDWSNLTIPGVLQ